MTRWRRIRPGVLLLALAPFLMALALVYGGRGLASPTFQAATCPDPESVVHDLDGPLADVRYLADDALQGREVASPGARCAGEYLARRFQALGLEPAGPEGSWFQTFEIRGGTELGPDNLLKISADSYTLGEAWVPFGFSGSGGVSAQLMYGAHGISRPGDPEDAYFHQDLEGKIVVVESGDPASPSGRSVHADPHFKAALAAGRGAAGLLVLLADPESFPDVAEEVRGSVGIPVAAVQGPAAQRIRAASREGARATLRADVRPRMVEARNVVALLPGTDPELAQEWIVVGAHYDHLGLGGEGSLAPDTYGAVHNGADDNASGTAALLDAARRLKIGGGLRRSVLFIAFTGEEKGLWGSTHYVEEPLHPLERTAAMLNLDMVGRLEGGPLTVFGLGTAEEWRALLDFANLAQAPPLTLAYVDDGFGPSDHSSFYAKGVPVLHFFTNTHADYHRPSDDWQKIDAEGLEWVSALVTGVVRQLAGHGERVAADLTRASRPASPHGGGISPDPGAVSEAPGRGYGPYLGTIPDMTPSDQGVRLTGVREGSPAQKAGIRGGDVVVEFQGREIADLYAYTYALRDHQPGDTVLIVVERDGERLGLTAVLGERR